MEMCLHACAMNCYCMHDKIIAEVNCHDDSMHDLISYYKTDMSLHVNAACHLHMQVYI